MSSLELAIFRHSLPTSRVSRGASASLYAPLKRSPAAGMEQVLHNSLWASQICSEPTPWREAAGLDVTATTVNFGNTQHDARHVDGYWKARRHAFHRRYHSLESRFDDNCSPIGDRLRAWSLSAGRARARPRGALQLLLALC